MSSLHQRGSAGGTVWRESTRGKARHVLMNDAGYIGRRMLTMELPGKRKRGRPKRRFMDAVREGMTAVEVTEEEAGERADWQPPKGAAERRRRIMLYIIFHLLMPKVWKVWYGIDKPANMAL